MYIAIQSTNAVDFTLYKIKLLLLLSRVTFQASLVYVSRSVMSIIRGLGAVFLVSLLLVLFTPIGFPFSTKSSQRHYILVSATSHG